MTDIERAAVLKMLRQRGAAGSAGGYIGGYMIGSAIGYWTNSIWLWLGSFVVLVANALRQSSRYVKMTGEIQ